MSTSLPFRCFDGAFGTYYFQLTGDAAPCESANLSHPDTVSSIHHAYLKAGADAIKTNTFALHAPTFPDAGEREALRAAGYRLACQAARPGSALVFCDIGPVLDDESIDPASAYLEAARSFLALGGTHFLFETQQEFTPLLPALEAVRRAVPDAFIAVTFAVSQDGYSKKGLSALSLLSAASGHPAVSLTGLNCVCGPVHMAELFRRLPPLETPLVAMPNAGYPSQVGGRTFFQDNAAYFAEKMADLYAARHVVVGGCCGTTPEHIRRTLLALSGRSQDAMPFVSVDSAPTPQRTRSPLSQPLPEKFVAVELDPPLDADFAPLVHGARLLQAAGVDMLTIADSPLARTRADSIMSAAILQRETGLPVLPHLSCRDKNHIAIKGSLLGACYEGIHQILAVTGDPIMQEVFSRRSAVFNFNSYELISFISELNRDVFVHAPFAVGGALNVNAPCFDAELQRALKKEACGASFFLTQPLYTPAAIENLALARRTLSGKLLAGFMPPASYKNALFLHNEVSGVDIPPAVLRALEGKDQPEAWDISVSYIADLMRQAAPHCDGYYLMTPLKKVELIVRLMQAVGL